MMLEKISREKANMMSGTLCSNAEAMRNSVGVIGEEEGWCGSNKHKDDNRGPCDG